ncbi:hypothetical protein [Lentibacillus amyloliquefaciens]|uniref:hypothetical protein n=1 Tax=Lentibacillus amyloliquefaciens TaxID=1472767 RepID=UPI0014704457|nr:hypothetical protein [Lentibacillus amyloliquefaciens]
MVLFLSLSTTPVCEDVCSVATAAGCIFETNKYDRRPNDYDNDTQEKHNRFNLGAL